MPFDYSQYVQTPPPSKPPSKGFDYSQYVSGGATTPTPRVSPPTAAPTPQAGAAPPGPDTPAQPFQNPLDPIKHAAMHGALTAASDVAGGANAVFGAPQRFVAGAGTAQGNPIDWARQGWNVMTHPFDQQLQDQTQGEVARRLGPVAGAGGAVGGAIGARIDQVMKLIGHPTNDEQFLRNVATNLTAQTLTDPLTWVPVLGQLGALNHARRAVELAFDAAKAVGGKVPGLAKATSTVRSLHNNQLTQLAKASGRQMFGQRPELDPHLDSLGKAARLSIEEKHIIGERAQEVLDRNLLTTHVDALKNARAYDDLPEAIKQRQLAEPWLHGTPEMRQQAEALGFKPEEAVASKIIAPEAYQQFKDAPEGLLKYNVRNEYLTMIKARGERPIEDSLLFKSAGAQHKKEYAGFEKPSGGHGEGPGLQTRLENRLRLGRMAVRQRRVDAETEQFLTEHGGWKGEGPIRVDKLSHGPEVVAAGWKRAVGSKASGLAKAGIKLNPLPHGVKNVGELAYLAGGPEAFGKGLGYAGKGLADAQVERLKNMGVSVDYLQHAQGDLSALEKLTAPQQKLLTRIEMGYRQARLDQLDRQFGPSKSVADEYRKAQILRDDLGDYRNASKFISGLQAIGGPFVAFRLGIVPRAVARAAAKNPQRLASIYRTQNAVNQELQQEGLPATFHAGDPAEDAARLFNPFTAKGYLESTATLGPLGEVNRLVDPHNLEGLGQFTQNVLSEYAPGLRTLAPVAGLIPGAPDWLGGFPYGSTPGVSPMAQALGQVFGTYFQKDPSRFAERTLEQKAGN